MHAFPITHRDELIERCKMKVAQRPYREATEYQLANGVPMVLDQMTRTLAAEENNQPDVGILISGPSGGDAKALSELGVTATAHGKELLNLGYSLDQVVHDYGDLCQSITDMAFERNEPFTVGQFRTLNRCLDNAIADSVTEFSAQRDAMVAQHQLENEKQRLGFLAHELRNALETATHAVRALELSDTTPSMTDRSKHLPTRQPGLTKQHKAQQTTRQTPADQRGAKHASRPSKDKAVVVARKPVQLIDRAGLVSRCARGGARFCKAIWAWV